jgi:hypothetical protein
MYIFKNRLVVMKLWEETKVADNLMIFFKNEWMKKSKKEKEYERKKDF